MGKLDRYQKMRDFGETPEPSGAPRASQRSKRPIFVIQKHAASHLHYDFRLEMEGVLKSWAVPKGPSYDPGVRRLAMMTEDHPYDYASFEGVIPAGNYGAGKVIIWDEGTWEHLEPGDDPVQALAAGKITFRLYGKKLFGEWALVHIRGRTEKDNEWLLLKHRDEYASTSVDVTKVAPQSVVSGLGVDEIGGENIWESNRKASVRKASTVADELRKEGGRARKPATRKAAARAAGRKPAAKRAPAKKAAARSVRKPAARRKP